MGETEKSKEAENEKRGSRTLRLMQNRASTRMPRLPKVLSSDEKKYLVAVQRGDIPTVKRYLQKAKRENSLDPNATDSLGRGALLLAIEGEHLSMVELLIVMGVKTLDSLLHAIDSEFVEAVELLLEHEELIHNEGKPYSWEEIDRDMATFPPEITPLILAAHKNNYEILKILLDRGATLPMPHELRCTCEECIRGALDDSLRYSASRINSYKALASPSLIALTSTDPLLTAFELSWELKQLAVAENEFRVDYSELRTVCQEFSVSLLSHVRTSRELKIMLNYDPKNTKEENDPSYHDDKNEHLEEFSLERLRLGIAYKQKKFVAHPWVQQLLSSLWYEGLPGFRKKTLIGKCVVIVRVIVLFPAYCMLNMLSPESSTGRLMRKPFMKFLIHTASYLFFLLLLILVSQGVEDIVMDFVNHNILDKYSDVGEIRKVHRGKGPQYLEILVAFYVIGFIREEFCELYKNGIKAYAMNLWNAVDFMRNMLYVTVALLRLWAYAEQQIEINQDPERAYIPREEWSDFDPQLISEGLFAAANIFSALKLVHLSTINPYLGPLQISLGRMVVDIIKFFFFYTLVLFAFACGLNQLLWYFADLEKQKCYSLPGGLPDWNKNGEACMKWRRFGNLFEASQSLFWASFGMVGLSDFELTGIKSYTRFWGLLMFGSYSIINVIVLLNLLIAMMSNSYSIITEKSDVEWKFARTKLWLSYFADETSSLPSPFNLLPTMKEVKKLTVSFAPKSLTAKRDEKRNMSQKEKKAAKREEANEYKAVMRSLVWRYISALQRKADEAVVTEDDVNEVKREISALRCDLVELFRKNGMNITNMNQKSSNSVTKKAREWERRLFKGFHVAPAAGDEATEKLLIKNESEDSLNEGGADRFRRMARLALVNREQVARPKSLSHIGRSTSEESFQTRSSLRTAMAKVNEDIGNSGLKESDGKESNTLTGPDKAASKEKLNVLGKKVAPSLNNYSAADIITSKSPDKRKPSLSRDVTREAIATDAGDTENTTIKPDVSHISETCEAGSAERKRSYCQLDMGDDLGKSAVAEDETEQQLIVDLKPVEEVPEEKNTSASPGGVAVLLNIEDPKENVRALTPPNTHTRVFIPEEVRASQKEEVKEMTENQTVESKTEEQEVPENPGTVPHASGDQQEEEQEPELQFEEVETTEAEMIEPLEPKAASSSLLVPTGDDSRQVGKSIDNVRTLRRASSPSRAWF